MNDTADETFIVHLQCLFPAKHFHFSIANKPPPRAQNGFNSNNIDDNSIQKYSKLYFVPNLVFKVNSDLVLSDMLPFG